MPVKIFFCYAHEDEALLNRLKTHLKPLQQQGLIDVWHDRDIRAGAEWEREISQHLTTADIILLLVSPDFMASEYCYSSEMKRALERHERKETCMIPVILRPIHWQGTLGKLQALPKDALPVTDLNWPDIDSALYNVTEGICTIVEALMPPSALKFPHQVSPSSRPKLPHNLPSRGDFDFVGREAEMQELLDMLSSPRYPLLSIEGMGGIGKTALAIEVAYYCLPGSDTRLDKPFDVIAWISARYPSEQKLWFNEVLNTIARVLGYQAITQMPQEQKTLEIDQLLRMHRTLVIIDNFETIEDGELVKWIQLHVPEPSKTLITHRYHKIRKVYDIQLEGLEVGEALALIHNYIRRFKWLSAENTKDEKWHRLVRVTEGNPGIIEMALGCMKRGKFSLDELVENLYAASRSVDDLFRYLYAHSWEEVLCDDAKQALLVLPFFAELVSKEAVGATSGLAGYHLDFSLEELVELALLKVNGKQVTTELHYSTHPLTRAFVHAKLQEMPEFEEQARGRWCRHYVDFVRRKLVRKQPEGSYWNTVSSPGFMLIDPEWDNIRQVLIWVDMHEHYQILLELVWLLVHYMDRRFQHIERVYYVQKAAAAASKLGHKEEEAHFRIDALGWTFIDQNRFEEARQEITTGLQIVEGLPDESECKRDLTILAKTFLARILLQQGDVQKALAFIDEVDVTHCSPIIKSRVYMIEGDIACRKQENVEAIRIYQELIRCTKEYGGEGTGSEQYFRLGLAYLAHEDVAEAEAAFHEVLVDTGISGVTIEILYAKYGLAAVAKARGERDEAIRLAQETREALSRLLQTHYLLDLVDHLLQELKAM